MKKYISPETLNIMVTAGGLLMGSRDSEGLMDLNNNLKPGELQYNFGS